MSTASAWEYFARHGEEGATFDRGMTGNSRSIAFRQKPKGPLVVCVYSKKPPLREHSRSCQLST
jgi:hypothetical protein